MNLQWLFYSIVMVSNAKRPGTLFRKYISYRGVCYPLMWRL